MASDSDCESVYTDTFENLEDVIPEEIKNITQLVLQCRDFKGAQRTLHQYIQGGVYHDVIEHLKLQEYYPKKLTREKALVVTENTISSDDLNDPGKIPWYILQNLIMCNYEGRCFKLNQNPSLSGFEFSSLLQVTTNNTVDTIELSPLDALVALFLCCDDFLRQLLVEKMSMCQLAIPLLLPYIDTIPHTNEMLLWAMSTLRKQWKTCSGLSCERSMLFYPLPTVCAIRLGRPRLSKSKILNCVISDFKHDIFFHSGCKGGTLEKKISVGLLEMAWYLPTGKHQDTFPDAITFMNLRGNASHLKEQSAFLSDISLATIAFTSSDEFKEEDTVLLESLYKQNGHLILVADGPPGQYLKESISLLEKKYSTVKDKHLRLIDSSKQNKLQVSGEIRKSLICIYKGNGRYFVTDRSIQMYADLAKTMRFHVDESTLNCIQAKENVDMMSECLKLHGKEKHLPLHVITIEIGQETKERYRLKKKGTMETEKYVEKVELNITELRSKQKCLGNHTSDMFKLFRRSYTPNYPALKRKYFHSFVKMITDIYSIETLQPILQEYIQKFNDLCEILQKNQNRETPESEKRRKELDDLESKLSNLSLGLEHFNREIGQVYEMEWHMNLLNDTTIQFPVVVANMLLDGHPLELMDGDASHVPITWIKAVLTSLTNIIGDKRMFVLSVLGIQSSGKSTMLNTMFGLQFAVSAGRCTKGVFAQLIPVDDALKEDTKCDYILVVDTEGLRAPELATTEHNNRDNELATFVTGLGDVTMLNIMGENAAEMQDILQIAVHAFIKMENVNIKPSCIFVHQNVTDVAASDKNTAHKRKIKSMLDQITLNAATEESCTGKYKTFSDVIRFQEHKHIMYISSLWQGDPPMAPPNPGYSQCILQVKKQIIEFMRNCQAKTVEDFKYRLSDLWKAILCENFVFSFKNTIEIRAFNALETEYVRHSRTLRRNAMTYGDELQIECNKLTANEIHQVGKSILGKQIAKFEKDINSFHNNIEDYFARETKACQWKARTELKRDDLCADIRREINDEFVSIRKKIVGKSEINSSMIRYEKDILKKAKGLAEIFRENESISGSDLKKTFDEEWGKWISDIAPSSGYIQIQSSLEEITRKSYSRYQEEVNRMLSSKSSRLYQSGVFVGEDDLDFGSVLSKGVRLLSGRAVSKSTCFDEAKSFTETLRSEVLRKISNYSNECKNYSASFGSELFDFLATQLSDMKIEGEIKFKEKGIVRITMCILWSMIPKLNELQIQYRHENDPRSYMESQKERLWQMFRDECTVVEIYVKAASVVSRELESAIRYCLPNHCKTGVIDYLRTSPSRAFTNKMSLHAQMLIDIARKHHFTFYREYLRKPYRCMSTYIGEYITKSCLLNVMNEGNSVLQGIYNQQLGCLFVKVVEAITDTCQHYDRKCKISSWWPKFLEHIGHDLAVKTELGFFNEDGSFEVDDLKEKLLSELNRSKDKIMDAFNPQGILNAIVEPCQQFFEEDLLGCPELCPFCKAPCDLQVGDKYDDHRTEYHRPSGVAGYKWHRSRKLSIDICTTSVMSDNSFKNKDTKQKWHPHKKYQTVDKYYKAWKIQPVAGESQLYWKWFMATYNEELAKYYECEQADIPDGWKKITWDSVKEDMINTYNL
ncbi:interferon-induced very large GTPase 1-like [Anneissia japonica]|uniref:interferon-induced very large GTPase 1-like n=1 Tax=Anneissia japonica TaxID=1529436 RepID=UPI001425865F|nr:interferon-induced very large GTPase 1-like [Anneissia japonica]